MNGQLILAAVGPSTAGGAAGGGGSIIGLILFILLALGVSFLCSILEAALLSTSPSHIEQLARQGRRAGRLMRHLKNDVDRPISAILTLNTVAHTVGAAGAGAQAARIFGSTYTGIISALLTLAILVLSEIIPKTLGAVYWRTLTPFTAYTTEALTRALLPVVWILERITAVIRGGRSGATITRGDIAVLAKVGSEEGTLGEEEGRVMNNMLSLQGVSVDTIMTPRTVVTAFPRKTTVAEVLERYKTIPYSRLPVYEDTIDTITGYVLRAAVLEAAAADRHETKLKELEKPIGRISEANSVTDALRALVQKQQQIVVVQDEYGGTAGIITMEDVFESLLGLEILDETDVVQDLQVLARERFKRYHGKLPEEIDEPEQPRGDGGPDTPGHTPGATD
jgi:CBS domain containing-hemolysin-like protein